MTVCPTWNLTIPECSCPVCTAKLIAEHLK
jgi:hypothetical protein